MPNSAYLKGRAFEYRLCAHLKAQGAKCVIRAAGSHGLVDVVAVERDGVTRLYQCKPGPSRIGKVKEAGLTALNHSVSSVVTYIAWPVRGGVAFRLAGQRGTSGLKNSGEPWAHKPKKEKK